MDDEKVLQSMNETLRIVGMYSFLFYAGACGVLLLLKDSISICFVAACFAVVCLAAIAFFAFSTIVIYKAYKKYNLEIKEIKVKNIVHRNHRRIKPGG
jgi:cobalamin biosynthesis protein CobD/CbiB